MNKFCECGCGKKVSKRRGKFNRFICGHTWRGKHLPKDIARKIGESNVGKELSDETRNKISIARKGMKLSDNWKENISKALIGNSRRLGIPHSEETKKRISKANKGLIKSEITRRKLSISMTGRTLSDNHKAKLSIIASQRTGNKNSNWNGGSSNIPYPFDFNISLKKKIEERDNHTCQICGKLKISRCSRFAVHHIDYDKNNSSEDNLIFLCEKCHNKTNQVNGREKWINLLKQNFQRKEVIAQ